MGGLEIGHFQHPHYRNVYLMHQKMRKAETQFESEAKEGVRVMQDPGVLVAQAMTLSSILMYRCILQSMSFEQMTFLQNVRVIPPYKQSLDRAGNVSIKQSYNCRWTSPAAPSDFFTHIVIKNILNVKMREDFIRNTNERKNDPRSRRTQSHHDFRKNLNKILPHAVGDNLWQDRSKATAANSAVTRGRLSRELIDMEEDAPEYVPLMDIIGGKVKHTNLDEKTGLRKRVYTQLGRDLDGLSEEDIKRIDRELDNMTGYSKDNIYNIKK